ncbi:peptidase E [Listeria seeligeri]|uniref:peptidase E n=1 Tax=Listeria seeligeri TaxID=1640 RepID=UPI0010E2B4D6|nr:Type 1 glutamine amidotransferase-like domain-containing protein [Listeria seeligeri]MBC1424153.1 type 1 glutamine amidotransferase-like domain-containing protein [Listeria seeligeri]MBC1430031.1 type 1 glutamine amidotransferase-like domain-containing protein [Listeria seeligeri]MBC1442793.1 type 1 glutamine amidotransferase-like domain-containing protein [Listeria seeligeri]MBC1479749.1 type 1 glutamine amidotransferase-like domain-containing protein [Listeria seeligeri]MBC1534377.1 type 
MKKLFLSSSFTDVAALFSDFEKDLAGKTVTFIPTASLVEDVVFYVKAGKKALENLGLIIDELDVSTASFEVIAKKIAQNDVIYVTGGNTFFLLQELKRTGADKLITAAVEAGKLYVGESAGAVITGANIRFIEAMDSINKAPDLTNYDALNLVDFCTVPHFNSVPFKKIAQKIVTANEETLKLVPISNKEAILIQNNEVTVTF